MGSFENRYINPKGKDENEDEKKLLNRRDFLQLAGAIGVSTAMGMAGKKVYEVFSPPEEGQNYEEIESEAVSEKSIVRKKIHHPELDREVAHKVLEHYDSGKIKLENVKLATEHHWHFKYLTNPKLAKSLEDAYVNMQPWVPELKRVFEEEKVPVEFIYLAIPESHWSFDQVSPKGAAGPYQIMAGTARLYGLRVDSSIDERKDVIKSARVCAKHLREIYDKTGNWDLAASGYNGSFVNKYIGWCRKKGRSCSYEGFIQYLEQRVNGLKEDLAKKEWEHKIGEKQSLESIGEYYDMKWIAIARFNKLEKDKKGNYIMQTGKKLRIPIGSKKTKKLIYDRIIGGYIENINYPGKYNAVMDIINSPDFQKKVGSRIGNESRFTKK